MSKPSPPYPAGQRTQTPRPHSQCWDPRAPTLWESPSFLFSFPVHIVRFHLIQQRTPFHIESGTECEPCRKLPPPPRTHSVHSPWWERDGPPCHPDRADRPRSCPSHRPGPRHQIQRHLQNCSLYSLQLLSLGSVSLPILSILCLSLLRVPILRMSVFS